jgi:hypothetical protein
MKGFPELIGSGNPEAHDYAAGLPRPPTLSEEIARECSPLGRPGVSSGDEPVTSATAAGPLAVRSSVAADEMRPHSYFPSTMHMGDCAVCGNVADHPLHKEPLKDNQ